MGGQLVVFADGGVAALIAALVSTGLALRAGVVSGPHPSGWGRRPQRTGASATARPALEVGEGAA